MGSSREGKGRLFTRSGQQCTARYLLKCWEAGQGRTEGTLKGADPDVALASFRPGDVAMLELGSGDTLEIDITGVLPGDEIIFTVRHRS